jgi:hypothetical protein
LWKQREKRLVSQVAYHVSEQDRLNLTTEGFKDDAFFRDRETSVFRQKAAQDLGVDLGKGFEEKLDKLLDPASVLKDSE